MTVDDVVKGLKLCATCGSLSNICPKCPYCGVFNCNNKLKEDAASLILQGELNKDTFTLLDDQSDMIAELNCWNKLLWRFIHSDKEIEDSFYKFYKIKKKGERNV